jgi:TRAP transporter TAXI family solute receptor
MKMIAITRILILLLLAGLLGACERGPDAQALRTQVQSTLDQQFKEGLFEVVSLKRAGSAPFTDKASADDKLTVYFNARIRFLADYNLTAWDSLNFATLGYLLGATEKGIEGVSPGGNKKGDILKVYGTSTYALRSGQWRPIPNRERAADAGRASSETQQLIDELQSIYEQTAGRRGGAEAKIVDKEIRTAVRKINTQLDKLKKVYSVASGPRQGVYYRNMRAFEEYLRNKPVKIRNYETEGSVENCNLVQNKSVDLAVVQSNIAAMAYRGQGLFRERGPMKDLRALASLHPEMVHVIVPAKSGITTLEGLKGKRIDIGLPESGSRVDALRILDALDLRLSDFSEVREEGLAGAIEALKNGELDGFFVTIHAPARALQDLASAEEIRILPLDQKPVQALTEGGVYIPYTLPAKTYPGQGQPVQALGLTAMLIGNRAMPDARVEEILGTLLKNVNAVARKEIRTSFISRQKARTGISIPLHPAAEKFYAPLLQEKQEDTGKK